jgi:hypothetical protein
LQASTNNKQTKQRGRATAIAFKIVKFLESVEKWPTTYVPITTKGVVVNPQPPKMPSPLCTKKETF